MKKSTFFLSLFLTVSGVATTNAQGTSLKAEDIKKDGRVITLKGNNQPYIKLDGAGLSNFDPYETAVVVETAEEEGKFYLKKYSTKQYLQEPTGDGVVVTLGDKNGAARFTITDAYVTTPNDIRFVTTFNNTTVYLNTNTGNDKSSYFHGTSVNSVFAVFDAAELCKTSVNMGDAIYVGDLVITEETKNELQNAYDSYNAKFSEDNYTAVVNASDAAVKSISPAAFDASLYYLIENNYNRGAYMETTDDQKLSWSDGISDSASQIWYFETEETEAEETEAESLKYFMSTQGVFCNEPKDDTPVTLSDATNRASFYIIEMSAGVYAFDSGLNYAADRATNQGKGLHKNTDTNNNHIVKGWGTYAGLSQWKLKYARTYTVVMPNAGWTTLYLPFAVSLPEDESLTASYPTDAKKYTDNGVTVNSVEMTPLTGNEIPAKFPVVLQGEASKSYTLTILSANHEILEEDDWEANKFKGVLLPEPVDAAAMYKLAFSDGKFTLSEVEGSVTIAANSAYIPFSSVTTGITDVVADTNADNVWFDLVGRRVLNPAKGVYVNAAGKKALFK